MVVLLLLLVPGSIVDEAALVVEDEVVLDLDNGVEGVETETSIAAMLSVNGSPGVDGRGSIRFASAE